MDETIITSGIIIITLFILIIAVVILIFLQLRKPRGIVNNDSFSVALQNLTQSVNQNQTQVAVLSEKVTQLEPATKNINTILTTDLANVKEGISLLYAQSKARQEDELRTSQSIKRLETIIAGTRSKGAAGENIVEQVFAKLPIEWQVRNFVVNGKTVEFGLKLPSSLILPIDSKWPATNLIEEYSLTDDTAQQQRIKAEIEKSILQKAKEVSKYIDPSITMPFGIAVIPDAAYEFSSGIQAEAFQKSVVLVSYSNFVPYLFLVLQTTVKTLHSVDMQKLDAYLHSVLKSINALQEELDGRFSKALTMLSNSKDDMHSHVSKASGSITSLQISGTISQESLSLPETSVDY